MSTAPETGTSTTANHDTTFMHLKKKHMRNGQLKPGYNVNVATSNEFIIGTYIFPNHSDVQTLIPFMEQLRTTYPGRVIEKTVVGFEYESEENYCWFERHPEVELHAKPSNHEIIKTKKYRTAISRRGNMKYDPEADAYTCACGKQIKSSHVTCTSKMCGLLIAYHMLKVARQKHRG